MKIKRVEIKGFKSFPESTVLEFKPGATAVVGPNGCGKSNVLEAIRWVMGEQRVRTLRGKKMEDVIFNGSEARKPVGMAEVTLVLSNSEGMCPPSMAEYDEIMIARRLFRDGDSQYEINGVPCRLSDVTDFFLDTGVGRNSYAIIEQGRVDMVVASKPEDRRVLIEEAAGITRYKSRKETALKRLEQTRQNLVRIGDLVSEVKRHSTSLKKQASKAERYRTLTERLRELDIGLHAYKCAEIRAQLGRVSEDLQGGRVGLSQKEAQYGKLQAELEESRVKALKVETDLKDLQEARHKTELDLTSVKANAASDRSRISQLEEQQKRRQLDHAREISKKQELEEGLRELEQSATAIQAELKEAREQWKLAADVSRQSTLELESNRKLVDSLRDDLFTTLQESAQQKNRGEMFNRRRNEIRAALKKIEADSEAVRTQLAVEENEKNRLTVDLAETARRCRSAVEKASNLATQQEESKQRVVSLREQVSSREKELAGENARLQSLEEMQKDYASYDEGVRFLMKGRESHGNGDLLGPLAEAVEVTPELEKALAAALGDRLGHVVVSSTRAGIEAANRVREADAGRVTLMPLTPRCEFEENGTPAPVGLTPIRELVHFKQGFEELGSFLLGRCFVVDHIHQALEIWENNGIHVDLVTRSGEVLNRYGEITGGSWARGGEEVFRKRREIETSKQRVRSTGEALSQTRSSLKEQEALLQQLTSEVEQERQLIAELKMREVRLRKDLERVEAQVTTAHRRLEVMEMETERHSKEDESLEHDIHRSNLTLESLETKRQSLERTKHETQQRVEELESSLRETTQRHDEIRVRLAQMEERARSFAKEIESSRAGCLQCEARLGEVASDLARIQAELTALAGQIESSADRERKLMVEHQTQTSKIDAGTKIASELTLQVKSLEDQSSAMGRMVREFRESNHGLEVESARLEQTLRDLVEKILERHQIDPADVPCPETKPDENEIAEVRSKLECMGEVNLAAIGDSRIAEERLTFLTEQEDDLKKAVESLHATINTINKTTSERFREAFDRVNEKFQEIFPFLFRGGTARLELTDEADLLETGVEIMARPPGKRFQNMDLLSGGEKALTAVALIFSIFLTRPSPFCLLDEVDAPLDESNLTRFHEMLKQLSDKTQFIFITHNKISMQAADSLYGITMEDPGVSKIVSVEFAA